MIRIVIASGKGGTGKTMLAANIAYCLSQKADVTLADCDVEEPNVHLFFPSVHVDSTVCVANPEIDREACTLCGRCADFCRYGALVVMQDKVFFNSSLCHSCGGCMLVCPERAISEKPRVIGAVEVRTPSPTLRIITGRLNEGEVAVPFIISSVKTSFASDETVIIDGPPGIACPVIETLRGADACILVTEPTPFGLHDLILAADVAEKLGIPASVVINKSDGRDEDIVAFCEERGIPLLLRIPYSREWARLHGEGDLIARHSVEWQEKFLRVFDAAVDLGGGGK